MEKKDVHNSFLSVDKLTRDMVRGIKIGEFSLFVLPTYQKTISAAVTARQIGKEIGGKFSTVAVPGIENGIKVTRLS